MSLNPLGSCFRTSLEDDRIWRQMTSVIGLKRCSLVRAFGSRSHNPKRLHFWRNWFRNSWGQCSMGNAAVPTVPMVLINPTKRCKFDVGSLMDVIQPWYSHDSSCPMLLPISLQLVLTKIKDLVPEGSMAALCNNQTCLTLVKVQWLPAKVGAIQVVPY